MATFWSVHGHSRVCPPGLVKVRQMMLSCGRVFRPWQTLIMDSALSVHMGNGGPFLLLGLTCVKHNGQMLKGGTGCGDAWA